MSLGGLRGGGRPQGKRTVLSEVHYLVFLLALAAQYHLQIWKLLQYQDM